MSKWTELYKKETGNNPYYVSSGYDCGIYDDEYVKWLENKLDEDEKLIMDGENVLSEYFETTTELINQLTERLNKIETLNEK